MPGSDFKGCFWTFLVTFFGKSAAECKYAANFTNMIFLGIWVIFTIMCQNCIFDVPRHFMATLLVWVSNIAFVLILSPLPIKYMHIVILVLQKTYKFNDRWYIVGMDVPSYFMKAFFSGKLRQLLKW